MEFNSDAILENVRLLLKEGNYREVKTALMPYLNQDPTDPEARLYFNLANLDGEMDGIKEYRLTQAIKQNFSRASEVGVSYFSDFAIKNCSLIEKLLENRLTEIELVDVGDTYLESQEAYARILLALIYSCLNIEVEMARQFWDDYWDQVKSLAKSNIFKHVPFTINGKNADQDDLLKEINKVEKSVQKDSLSSHQ